MDAFLNRVKEYCTVCAPSGLESPMREKILQDIQNCNATWEVDPNGNLIVFKKGRKRRAHKLLLSAHMDEVGFMVTYVGEDGMVWFDAVGGIDRRVVSGRRVRFCKNGISGIVASKSIHIQTKEEFGMCEPINEMQIDIGTYDRESASKLVKIGDCAVFQPNFEEFGDGLIKSKAIDDRFGCAVLVELIQSDLEYDTYFAFVTCEEIGCDGSKEVGHRLQPEIAIVLEATTAGDIYGAPEGKRACCLRSGAVISHMDKGTIYPKELVSYALQAAKEQGIACQLKTTVAGGNDARSYQQSGIGARVLAVSAPVRYIHSACGVAAKEDLHAVKALTEVLIGKDDLPC